MKTSSKLSKHGIQLTSKWHGSSLSALGCIWPRPETTRSTTTAAKQTRGRSVAPYCHEISSATQALHRTRQRQILWSSGGPGCSHLLNYLASAVRIVWNLAYIDPRVLLGKRVREAIPTNKGSQEEEKTISLKIGPEVFYRGAGTETGTGFQAFESLFWCCWSITKGRVKHSKYR